MLSTLLRSFWNLFVFRAVRATHCGHRTRSKGVVQAYGEQTIMQMPRHHDGSIDWCLGCIEAMTIRCALCGKPIFIGDLIALPVWGSPSPLPSFGVVYGGTPLRVVACLRVGCADSGADCAGSWMPEGETKRGHVRRARSVPERSTPSERSLS